MDGRLHRLLAILVFSLVITLSAVGFEPPRPPRFDRNPGVFREYTVEERYEQHAVGMLALVGRRVLSVREYDEAGRLVVQSGDWGRHPYELSIGQIRYSYDNEGRIVRIVRSGAPDAISVIRYVDSAEKIPESAQLEQGDGASEIQWFDTSGHILRHSTFQRGEESERVLYYYEDGQLSMSETFGWGGGLSSTKTYEFGTNFTIVDEQLYSGNGERWLYRVTEWNEQGQAWRIVSFNSSDVLNFATLRKFAPDGTYVERRFSEREELDEYFQPDGTLIPSLERIVFPGDDARREPVPVDPEEWSAVYDGDPGYPTTFAVVRDKHTERYTEVFVESRRVEYGFQVPYEGANWVPQRPVQFRVRDRDGLVRSEEMEPRAYGSDGFPPEFDPYVLQGQLGAYVIPDFSGTPDQKWALERLVEAELLKSLPPYVLVAIRQ